MQVQRIDLDADLEEEQHDADVREHLELVTIRDVAGRELRHEDPDGEVADHRGERDAPRRPARERREREDEPELEDRRRRRLHRQSAAR